VSKIRVYKFVFLRTVSLPAHNSMHRTVIQKTLKPTNSSLPANKSTAQGALNKAGTK
jgi:hypothetical protein